MVYTARPWLSRVTYARERAAKSGQNQDILPADRRTVHARHAGHRRYQAGPRSKSARVGTKPAPQISHTNSSGIVSVLG